MAALRGIRFTAEVTLGVAPKIRDLFRSIRETVTEDERTPGGQTAPRPGSRSTFGGASLADRDVSGAREVIDAVGAHIVHLDRPPLGRSEINDVREVGRHFRTRVARLPHPSDVVWSVALSPSWSVSVRLTYSRQNGHGATDSAGWYRGGPRVLSALGVVTYRASIEQEVAANTVAHTHRVMEALQRVVAGVAESESSVRAYTISRRPDTLRDFEPGIASAEEGLKRAAALTWDNHAQQRLVGAVAPLLAERVRLLYNRKLSADRGEQPEVSEDGQHLTELIRTRHPPPSAACFPLIGNGELLGCTTFGR